MLKKQIKKCNIQLIGSENEKPRGPKLVEGKRLKEKQLMKLKTKEQWRGFTKPNQKKIYNKISK